MSVAVSRITKQLPHRFQFLKQLPMNRFLLAAGLLLGSLAPALAQRLITQTAALGGGQSVFLDLKHAHRIRVRPGGAGLAVQATVVVNNNERNDVVSLKLEQSAAEVSVV